MEATILIIFTALFAGLAWRRLDFAVLSLIALLPAYLLRFKLWGLPSTWLEVMILICFAIWTIKNFLPNLKVILSRQTKRTPYPFSLEIILVLIISWLAVWIAEFSPSALGIWKAYFLEPIMLFILIFNVFKNREDLKKVLWAFLISAAAVSVFAVFQKLTGLFIANPFWAEATTRRSVSFFGYPNAIGLYLSPLVMLFSGWLFSCDWEKIGNEWLKKLLISSTILISLLAIGAARSEGALAGIIAAAAIFGLLANKKTRLITLLAAFVIIISVISYAPARNFAAAKLSLRDLSGQIRLQQWKETWQMLSDGRLITGAGLSQYQAAIKPYHQEGIFFNRDNLENFGTITYASSTLRAKYWQPVEIYMYPHNIFLNFWTELGLLGALLFFWLIGRYLFISIKLTNRLQGKSERYLTLGLLTAMVAILIHGLVDVPYFKNDLAMIFWILLALLGFLNMPEKENEKK